MAPPVSRIFDVCETLLTAVITRHGGVLPDRQYVSAGAPAWDCELVAVWCERTAGYEGNIAVETVQPSAFAGHTMRYGIFPVSIVRCLAVSEGTDMTSIDEEEAASSALYEDAQRSMNALVAAEKAGELTGCHSIAFAEWRIPGGQPSGGFVGGELRVRVGLSVG